MLRRSTSSFSIDGFGANGAERGRHENIDISFEKMQKWTPREIRQPKPIIDMKQNSCQNRKVSKTNGESKNFDGRMIIKSEIVKIHWIFVSFLKAPKRLVHETVENVTPAERCKIDEIGAT